jgi:hypothetical protein
MPYLRAFEINDTTQKKIDPEWFGIVRLRCETVSISSSI